MNKTKIIEVPYKNYSEYFITLSFAEVDRRAVKNILDEMRRMKINVIYVTCSGNAEIINKFHSYFKVLPVLYIGKSEKNMRDYIGIFIYALQGKGIKTEYIREKNEFIGTRYRLPDGSEGLFLKSPSNLNKKTYQGFEKQAFEAYKIIEKKLKKYAFSFKDIYRFWNYMENIDENYIAFNKTRDYYFKKHGIVDFPAGTGVEANFPGDQRISSSFEALRKKRAKDTSIETINSDLQCEACGYGPKFSRAKLISFKKDKVQKLFISGTSSVDLKGKSILTDDYEKNVKYVMSCVGHLLGKVGMSFEDIVMSRVYSKNLAIEKEFIKLYSRKKWNFPYNEILTNICRESFIFEIECIAAKKKINNQKSAG